MKIAVVGSRNFKDKDLFIEEMINFEYQTYSVDSSIISYISGGARGVDTWAKEFADGCTRGIKVIKPDWNKHGKKAGFLRNIDIINEADFVMAFWDGESKGTKHSIDLAIKAGKPINIYVRN